MFRAPTLNGGGGGEQGLGPACASPLPVDHCPASQQLNCHLLHAALQDTLGSTTLPPGCWVSLPPLSVCVMTDTEPWVSCCLTWMALSRLHNIPEGGGARLHLTSGYLRPGPSGPKPRPKSQAAGASVWSGGGEWR